MIIFCFCKHHFDRMQKRITALGLGDFVSANVGEFLGRLNSEKGGITKETFDPSVLCQEKIIQTTYLFLQNIGIADIQSCAQYGPEVKELMCPMCATMQVAGELIKRGGTRVENGMVKVEGIPDFPFPGDTWIDAAVDGVAEFAKKNL